MIRLRLLSACAALTGLMVLTACDKPNEVKAESPPMPVTKPVAIEKTLPAPEAGRQPIVAQAGQWVGVSGQVVWPKGAKPPAAKPINVTTDQQHCNMKGPLMSDDVVVNPKNSGLKNVWVYLRPDSGEKAAKLAAKDIAPALAKPASQEHVIDQPCCAFIPRILALREGDTLLVKNPSPVGHNIKLEADDPSPSFNKMIPSKGQYKEPKPFFAQRTPIIFSCSIHPWMGGKLMVFDHPYFAVTDDDGKFTIKDCPAGKYRLVYRHELGYHKGKDGALGWPVEIKAGADGKMTLEPLEFIVPENK